VIGKINAYNSSSIIATLPYIMKTFALRLILASSLAASLAACGSGVQEDMTTRTAASVTTGVQVATNTPAPDCAAENCKGLRVIDGNAESYRFDAMRRAADDSQS
jgi:hypothetical protein